MTPKIRNAIMFTGIALVLIFGYIFFIKGDKKDEGFISSSNETVPSDSDVATANSSIAQDFLNLLLSITSLRLEDSIFSDAAFLSLRDSSIVLVPDGNEGRPNPFAPIGSDIIVPPPVTPSGSSSTGPASTASPQTPVSPI